MVSVIKFLNENTEYNFHSQLDISIKTCVSDPQNSIIKSYSVLEHLIDELYVGYHLAKDSDDMSKLINGLSNDIENDVKNDMHSIRLIRNKASHHKESSYFGTSGSEVDFSEAIFVLKKLYDLLAWFVNLEKDPKLLFLPFQDLIDEIIDKSIEKKVINVKGISIEGKIGDFIQSKVMDLLEFKVFDAKDIDQLLLNEYSLNKFGLKYPFLTSTRSGKLKSRYYSKPVKINGKRYYINNAWNDNNKPMLYKWYEDLIAKI